MGLKEFMDEEKPINRWLLFRVALVSAFAGSLLTFMAMLLGLVR